MFCLWSAVFFCVLAGRGARGVVTFLTILTTNNKSTHHGNHGHVENDESWHPVTETQYVNMKTCGCGACKALCPMLCP